MNDEVTKEQSMDLYAAITEHLLNDEVPSIFLNQICILPIFQTFPFQMLHKMVSTEQSPIHHPEGNVWNHTVMVVDEAAKQKINSKNAQVFMWAALLHDIGKPPTTRNRKGKITSYDHDKVGAEMAKEFLSEFTDNKQFIDDVCSLIKYHMQMLFVINDLPFADINGIKQNTDIKELALLGLCDKLGRTGANQNTEKKNMETFLRICNNFQPERKRHGKSRNEKTRP